MRCLQLLLLVLCWSWHAAWAQDEEVPFIVSPDAVTLEMLRAAAVTERDHVIDLGSGDGRIVILAARRFGATGLGVEIVPELVARSQAAARAAGVADRVSFRNEDLFTTDLSPATVVTMYLLPDFNLRLRPRLLALAPGTRIVSHDWDMGDWPPDATTVVQVPDKPVGLEKSSRVHLWRVPAPIDGLWCGTGLLRGASLRLAQRYQQFDGEWSWRGRGRAVTGRVDGARLVTHIRGQGDLELQAQGGRLVVTGAPGTLSLARGMALVRPSGAHCG